jgi:hypothetical protein
MASGRIVRSIDQVMLLDAFLEEFGEGLADVDFDAISSGGFRGLATASLAPATEVDPRKQPFVAYQILRSLGEDMHAPEVSEIHPAEEPIVVPLLPLYAANGLCPPPEIDVLARSWDFHLLRHVVHALVRNDGGFGELVFQVDYPKGEGVVTLGMAPDTALETRARLEANVKVGVTGDLAFDVPSPTTQGGLSASVAAGSGLRFLYSWSYASVRATITASGTQSSYARWHVKQPQSLIGDVPFATILRVPKGAAETRLAISGEYTIVPKIRFLSHLWSRPLRFRFESADPIDVALPK